jgi:hypothetical protein
MREFSTTLKLIQSKSSNPTRKPCVEVKGYESHGDGGDALWVFNGVTGQTPSQSPAQLGFALLNDASGNQWKLASDNGDIRKVGASVTSSDNQLAILACHNSLSDGDRLIIPEGVFLTSNITTTKSLKIQITGELRRAVSSTDTDNVLDVQGDGSNLFGGGRVSWNSTEGNDSGRGEAIRLTGDNIRASNITGADTNTDTGNAWYIAGVNCFIESCSAVNSVYAGIRTNMTALDGSGEPTGQCTITNFLADDCRRGWVNNGHADFITIDNFQIKNPKANADVQLLGESGADIKFNRLNLRNTFVHQNTVGGALVKLVGIRTANLTNCDFDTLTSDGVDALNLQNEHTGTTTYQENTLNALSCRFRSYNSPTINVDHLNQWRINSTRCHFIIDIGGGRNDMIDGDAITFWYSIEDVFECTTSATTYAIRLEDVGDVAEKRFSFIRPKFTGDPFAYFLNTAGVDFNIGQLQVVGARLESAPTSANWILNSSTREAKVIISDTLNGKNAGRDFSALLSVANSLTASDYAEGDRVIIRDVGDTGTYMRLKGSSVWRDLS